MFLRDPNPTDGNGKAVQMKASPSSGVPHPAKEVPEDIKKTEFNDDFTLGEFEVEQLPPRKASDEEKKIEEKKAETPPKEEKVEEKVEEVKSENKKEEKVELAPYLKAPKKDDKEAKKEDGKEVIKQIIPSKGVTRDYTGHSAEEVAAFKQMSDAGYALAKKVIVENRELSKLKDSTYLQHENAYILDPQYQSMQTDAHYAKKEGDYWKDQLILLKSGKAWKPIVKWDVNGNPVLGEERQPNDQDEEQVRLMMNNCYQASNKLQGDLQSYPSRYKTQMTSDLSAIDQECKARFSWESDPKLLDYSLNIEGLGDRTLRQIREDFASILPVYMRSHPLVRVAGNLMIALRIGAAELAQVKNGKAVDEIKKEETERVEPTSERKPPAEKKPINGVTEFKALPTDF